jgi:hypothetical protein
MQHHPPNIVQTNARRQNGIKQKKAMDCPIATIAILS